MDGCFDQYDGGTIGRFMFLDSPTDTISIYTLDGTELFMQPINTIDASDVLPSDVAWRKSYGYTWSKDSPILLAPSQPVHPTWAENANHACVDRVVHRVR